MFLVHPIVTWLMLLAGSTAAALAQTGVPSARTATRAKIVQLAPAGLLNTGLGDYNGDGRTDLDDFAHFASCVTEPISGGYLPCCEVFDFNVDGDVDLDDMHTFQSIFERSKDILNDSCGSPTRACGGSMVFDTTGATTDGPDEPGACEFWSYTHIESDVWFCYQAACDGEAVVSLCGSEYDTKLAVYAGCECPTTTPIGCSDDDCSFARVDSRVVFQAQAGREYLVRAGGFRGDQGSGILSILCDVEVCGPGHGDCGSANGTPGCEDTECCSTTCAVDQLCCDVEWDDICACRSMGLCTGSFPACGPEAGSCATENVSPGCDDIECCKALCAVDTFCCCDEWDAICAEGALGLCLAACGDEQSGDCMFGNGSPGCRDAVCCETVCAQDLFCCSMEWDQLCADLAVDVCK